MIPRVLSATCGRRIRIFLDTNPPDHSSETRTFEDSLGIFQPTHFLFYINGFIISLGQILLPVVVILHSSQLGKSRLYFLMQERLLEVKWVGMAFKRNHLAINFFFLFILVI